MFFFFSSRRRHTRSLCDWSSDVCSSDLAGSFPLRRAALSMSSPTIAVFHDKGKPLARVGRKAMRSEERRVGKECRSRWSRYHEKKKKKYDGNKWRDAVLRSSEISMKCVI